MYFFCRYAEVCFAAASVYEEADAYDIAFSFIDYVYHFFDRAAGGDDVFYDEDFFTRCDFEAAAKGHLAIFSFGENGADAQEARGDLGEDDAAGSRADDGLDAFVFEIVCKFFAKLFGIFRMLQYIEFLYIQTAMETAGEKEMTFQDGFGFSQ